MGRTIVVWSIVKQKVDLSYLAFRLLLVFSCLVEGHWRRAEEAPLLKVGKVVLVRHLHALPSLGLFPGNRGRLFHLDLLHFLAGN